MDILTPPIIMLNNSYNNHVDVLMNENTSVLCSAEGYLPENKRGRVERRTKASHMNVHALMGRRKAIRRDQDGSHLHHTDYHEPHLFWSTIVIVLLCVFDAHYTLMLLERGGAELNHLMDYLIRNSLFGFFAIKYTLTALSLFILVAYSKLKIFKMIKIRYLIYGFLAIYSVLVSYELSIWPGSLMEIYPHL